MKVKKVYLKKILEETKENNRLLEQILAKLNGMQNNTPNNVQENIELYSTCINSYSEGLVIGSNKGNILFIEKLQNNEFMPVRYTIREREGAVTGLCFDIFRLRGFFIS